jgi:hypothetical protein
LLENLGVKDIKIGQIVGMNSNIKNKGLDIPLYFIKMQSMRNVSLTLESMKVNMVMGNIDGDEGWFLYVDVHT